MSERYDVCFSGQVLEGYDAETVRNRLCKLFKTDEATVDKLFSGKTQIVKRGCDKATALQYKKAMENAGAQPIFRTSAQPDNLSSQAPVGVTKAPSSDTASVNTNNSGITLAPPQSDVLKDSERQVVAEREVDTSMLQLNEAGALLASNPPAQAPTVNTDHISVAEVGADISELAPPAAQAPRVDLSALSIEPPGSDLLEEHQRRSNSGRVPPTDHLSLED